MNLLKDSHIGVDSWASLRQYAYTRMSMRSPLELSAPKAAIFPIAYTNPVRIDDAFQTINVRYLKRDLDKIFPYPTYILKTQARTRIDAIMAPQLALSLDEDSKETLKNAVAEEPCIHIFLADGFCPDALTHYGIDLLRMMLKRSFKPSTKIILYLAENALARLLPLSGLLKAGDRVWSLTGALPKLHTKPSLIMQSFLIGEEGNYKEIKTVKGVRGHIIYSAAYQWHEAHPEV